MQQRKPEVAENARHHVSPLVKLPVQLETKFARSNLDKKVTIFRTMLRKHGPILL